MFLSFPHWIATLGYFCILPICSEGTVFCASCSRLIYIILSIKKNGLKGRLTFIKSSDKKWTYIEKMNCDSEYGDNEGLHYFCDIVYNKGLLFAIHPEGETLSIDVRSGLIVKKLTLRDTRQPLNCCRRTYLMEFRGEGKNIYCGL